MQELAKFDTDKLKVMVYDLSKTLQRVQQELEILNKEISRREAQSDQEKEGGP